MYIYIYTTCCIPPFFRSLYLKYLYFLHIFYIYYITVIYIE